MPEAAQVQLQGRQINSISDKHPIYFKHLSKQVLLAQLGNLAASWRTKQIKQ